jgi:streptogramin lyase
VTTSGAFSTYGVSSFFRESGFLGESMVSGPDGALWYTFTGQNQPGLWRITTSGIISSISDPNIDHPGQLLVGPDGAFWMTTTHTYFQWFITRVALGGAITEYAAPATVTLLNPSINLLGQIAFSGSGVLWFPAGQDIGSVTFKAH